MKRTIKVIRVLPSPFENKICFIAWIFVITTITKISKDFFSISIIPNPYNTSDSNRAVKDIIFDLLLMSNKVIIKLRIRTTISSFITFGRLTTFVFVRKYKKESICSKNGTNTGYLDSEFEITRATMIIIKDVDKKIISYTVTVSSIFESL